MRLAARSCPKLSALPINNGANWKGSRCPIGVWPAQGLCPSTAAPPALAPLTSSGSAVTEAMAGPEPLQNTEVNCFLVSPTLGWGKSLLPGGREEEDLMLRFIPLRNLRVSLNSSSPLPSPGCLESWRCGQWRRGDGAKMMWLSLGREEITAFALSL